MPNRFSPLFIVGQNSKSNSANYNAENANIYGALNTVDAGVATAQSTADSAKATATGQQERISSVESQMGLVQLAGTWNMRPVTFADLKNKGVTFGMLRSGRVPFYAFQFWRFPAQ